MSAEEIEADLQRQRAERGVQYIASKASTSEDVVVTTLFEPPPSESDEPPIDPLYIGITLQSIFQTAKFYDSLGQKFHQELSRGEVEEKVGRLYSQFGQEGEGLPQEVLNFSLIGKEPRIFSQGWDLPEIGGELPEVDPLGTLPLSKFFWGHGKTKLN
jgi:hypothetical protein